MVPEIWAYSIVDQLVALKEYTSLQEIQYNVRYIHTVLIVHNYFAPRGVVNNLISESSYCSAHALGHTHINDITGPPAGLTWADSNASSQWHTVVSSYTPGTFFVVNPSYRGHCIVYDCSNKYTLERIKFIQVRLD